tara:strand:+ start:642 stop:1259 length:618 start_codon:yes stop_codon:yes gene_type:complete
MKKIAIIDYGSGNQLSLYNIIKHLGLEVVFAKNANDIGDCSHILIPGVGAYDTIVKKLKQLDCFNFLEKQVNSGKPVMGICVGMQILSDHGEENLKSKGLGWIPGTVKKINCAKKRLPHVGWNNINIKKKDFIFKNLNEVSDFYFVHSYTFQPNDKNNILATSSYEEDDDIVSIIKKDNIIGVQFHPEKSQEFGKILIKNFVEFY